MRWQLAQVVLKGLRVCSRFVLVPIRTNGCTHNSSLTYVYKNVVFSLVFLGFFFQLCVVRIHYDLPTNG